jgi:hypothetical protein
MIDAALVPEKTVVTAKGDGPVVDMSSAAGKVFLLTLRITRIIEQESIDMSVWGSPDGTNFGQKALATFPQKFYAGEHPLMLDLSAHPEIKSLRAHWEVNRWGRGSEVPMFELGLTVKEVPQEMLKEVGAAARR